MSQVRRLLFVCGHNLNRSLTAERLYDGFPGYEVRSVGIRREARVRITQDDIDWADVIFVMDLEHAQTLRHKFKPALARKRLVCLNIPDTYGYMSLALVELLKDKLRDYVQVPE